MMMMGSIKLPLLILHHLYRISVLAHVLPVTQTKYMRKQLILWNCRSLSGKINSIQYYVDHLRKRHKPHALFFTEAWLDYNINNNDTEYRSYKLQQFSREY